MIHEAARLDEAGSAQALQRDQKARREIEAGRKQVRFALDQAAQFEGLRTEQHFRAQRQVHAIEKVLADGSTIGAVLLAGHIGQRLLRLDLQFAVKRIGGVDRLYFDQRLVGAIHHARHGAHGGAFGKPALPFDEGAFFRRRFALIEREADIAAENALALRGNAGADRTATELTPPMAATPSAIQARKI